MKVSIHFKQWRFYLIVLFISFICAVLIFRMIDLAVIKQDFLLAQGNARSNRILTQSAIRGMILDREGTPLAISTPVFSIWMNPQEVKFDSHLLRYLETLLGQKSRTIEALTQKHKKSGREFVYVKRDVSPYVAKKIKSLKIPGIYQQEEYKRFYPEGEVTAHVVGLTNVDDKGQEGMELAYDKWLLGSPGKSKVIKDRKGRVISDIQNLQEKIAGKDLVLSIHRRIQYLAYRELLSTVKKFEAESGSVVVLDVRTGEILAMVNQPSFNPNNRPQQNIDVFRNRAVTDVFEPGSTIKAFSFATALDSGKYAPDTIIDTSPGWLRVGKNLVRDEHRNGPLTLTQILQKSSNVGTTKMILSLPPNQLWHLLHKVGFGETTGIGFPGERAGELVNREKWSPFMVATLAFGYGLSVTTLQLAQAYAVIANDGIKIPVSLLRVDQSFEENKLPNKKVSAATSPTDTTALMSPPASGTRVMSAKVARQMRELLESVVEKGGTGRIAAIDNYRVSGKTGTAEIAGKNGYDGHYVSSFVGMAPATNPRFVVAVVIRDAKGNNHYGGYIAGPAFKKIMEGTLHLFKVPPDGHTQKILSG